MHLESEFLFNLSFGRSPWVVDPAGTKTSRVQAKCPFSTVQLFSTRVTYLLTLIEMLLLVRWKIFS